MHYKVSCWRMMEEYFEKSAVPRIKNKCVLYLSFYQVDVSVILHTLSMSSCDSTSLQQSPYQRLPPTFKPWIMLSPLLACCFRSPKGVERNKAVTHRALLRWNGKTHGWQFIFSKSRRYWATLCFIWKCVSCSKQCSVSILYKLSLAAYF